MDTCVTDQMEEALTALQTVKPYDYAGAYRAAFSGIGVLDPRSDLGYDREWIYGSILAYRLWRDRMGATLELRAA